MQAQQASDPATWAQLVHRYRLSWEVLPDAALGQARVWDALLDAGIPQTALMRQLPRLTRLGMLPDLGGRTEGTSAQLTDPDRLRRGRVNPVNVLVAQRTYASGRSARGAGTWTPTRKVVDALDAAFYQAFGTVEPSGKEYVRAVQGLFEVWTYFPAGTTSNAPSRRQEGRKPSTPPWDRCSTRPAQAMAAMSPSSK